MVHLTLTLALTLSRSGMDQGELITTMRQDLRRNSPQEEPACETARLHLLGQG